MREHERQPVAGWPAYEDLQSRSKQGWKLVALEWERDAASRPAQISRFPVEIPYGLRVSDDGFHLEEDPRERSAIVIVLDAIVDDRPLSHAVAELNRHGFMTRHGKEWTSSAVFDLLPRLIEAGPSIFASTEWTEQRARRAQAT
jgi:hypothetical protein